MGREKLEWSFRLRCAKGRCLPAWKLPVAIDVNRNGRHGPRPPAVPDPTHRARDGDGVSSHTTGHFQNNHREELGPRGRRRLA
ncbi:MAG TPA: hypothetical protein EYN70_05280 [Planctomycetaceae bacterium]|nr:hypothetical protein [Planctomycetaceae bacterium]